MTSRCNWGAASILKNPIQFIKVTNKKRIRKCLTLTLLMGLWLNGTGCRPRFGTDAESTPEAKGVLGLIKKNTVELYLWAFPREAINPLHPTASDTVYKPLARAKGDRPMCYYRRYVEGDRRKPVDRSEELSILCSPSDTVSMNPRSLDQEFVEARLTEDRHSAEIKGKLTLTGALAGAGACSAAFGGFIAALPCSAVVTAMQRHFFVEVDKNNQAYNEGAQNYQKTDLSFEAIRALERTVKKTFDEPGYLRDRGEHFKETCPPVNRLPMCERFVKEGGKPLVSEYSGLKVACVNLGQKRIGIQLAVLDLKGSDKRSFDASGYLQVMVGSQVVFQKHGGALESAQQGEFVYAAPQTGPVTFNIEARVQIGDKIFPESVRKVTHTFFAHPKIGEGFYCTHPAKSKR